jgi:D-arabinose 1-dehydrogenase-like Zn-dependent alcohol dehydrogenase
MVELRVSDPGPGQVRLRVESCGVCHSDTATVEGQFPGLTLPRVPGHEVVGRIEAVGPGVSKWKGGSGLEWDSSEARTVNVNLASVATS